jgi:hypothetical protein
VSIIWLMKLEQAKTYVRGAVEFTKGHAGVYARRAVELIRKDDKALNLVMGLLLIAGIGTIIGGAMNADSVGKDLTKVLYRQEIIKEVAPNSMELLSEEELNERRDAYKDILKKSLIPKITGAVVMSFGAAGLLSTFTKRLYKQDKTKTTV